MSMRIPLVVTYGDGRTEKVSVGATDLIAFERQYDKPTSAISSGRLEYLWWAAWHAAKGATLSPFVEAAIAGRLPAGQILRAFDRAFLLLKTRIEELITAGPPA